MSSLHDRLQKIRREKKLSQTELANQVGLSLRAYQYYERSDFHYIRSLAVCPVSNSIYFVFCLIYGLT